MYLLDTNVVSELRKGNRAAPRVLDFSRYAHTGSLYVSAVTILELELGVLLMERRDPRQGSVLRKWLEQHVMSAFEQRVLPVDVTVARQAARLHASTPRPERDALIAATALVHDMQLVTRNVRDFETTGVRYLDPWGGIGTMWPTGGM